MIENIAAEISKMLNHLTPSRDFDHLIGMEAHMEKMKLLLRLDLDEVRMIGIWGPPGIGKTTIARFLFNQISSSFQNSAIMVNIKGSYPRPCLDEYNAQLQLQKQMLSQMTNQKDIVIPHLGVAQVRLRDRKVFLVLDDVDRSAQLDALAKNVQWFGPRSRIIITTENLQLLKAHGISNIYKVKFPSDDEALQMFCMYAFDQKTPKDGFAELAYEITYLVGQLPLGLKVMGSHFRGLPKQEWSMEVERLRTNIDGEIESVLKFSYDALCDEDKDLFLHVACLFNYRYIERVEEYLAGSFKNVRQRLHVLADKSLISFEYSYINMHILLVKLGKEIVRKQSVHEPGQRQFLVDDKDTCEVLTDYTAVTRSVVGIDYSEELNITKEAFELNITEEAFERMSILQFLRVGCYSAHQSITENAFERMSNLQFLRVRSYYDHQNLISSSRPLHYIFPKLRFLEWSQAPMTSLPFTINLEFLVELRMEQSGLEKLWDGIILLHNLKWMNLAFSRNLKELPNLSTATSLKELDLRLCSSLVELPLSIGNATNLQNLNLSGCTSLVELPSSIGNLHKLEVLNLGSCSSLKSLPININMESLDSLVLRDCSSLKSFPEISTNIRSLDLIGTSIKEVPLSIRSWSRLTDLSMPYSENLKEFPFIHNSITQLYLTDTQIQELGPWLSGCSRLRELVIKGMKNLVSLPQLPDSLRLLDAENCESLERLDFAFCNPYIRLKFGNCFKLNEEARDLIIQTSTSNFAVLPGGEVPVCFTYRASGSSVIVKLNQNPLHTSTKFKACILFFNSEGETEAGYWGKISVSCFTSKKNPLTNHNLDPILAEHLYIFEFEAKELTSTELVFKFEHNLPETWEIKECGILNLLEHHDFISNEEICERSSKRPRIL